MLEHVAGSNHSKEEDLILRGPGARRGRSQLSSEFPFSTERLKSQRSLTRTSPPELRA